MSLDHSLQCLYEGAMTNPLPPVLSRCLTLTSMIVCLALSPMVLANPTAGDVALMRAKQGEVEYLSKQRIEEVLTRLCPGRCELIDLKVNVTTPKTVGRVLPGFDTPTASEVEVEGIQARIMIDSKLPRTFRSNLPQMLTYRLSDLSSKILITPIQLKFPSPQLAPTPPPLPEIPERSRPRPQAEPPPQLAPLPPPEPVVEEPVVEEETLIKQGEEINLAELLLPWVPLGVILLFVSVLTLFVLRQLRRFQEALEGKTIKPTEEREFAAMNPFEQRTQRGANAAYPNSREEEQASMPDLTEMLHSLKSSRSIQNKVLRRWLEDDTQEVGLLVSLLGAEIMNDLKQDRSLKANLESLSHHIASLRTPVSSTQAWQLSYALRSRLNAAQILHDERALGATWEFMHGLSLSTLKQLFDPLNAAEQSHYIGQLPMELRSVFLGQITTDQRQSLMLFAGADAGLNRAQSLDLAHRLKRRSEELSPMSDEMNAQATLIIDMLNALPFAHQLESLLPLESQRPQVAHAVLRQLCLEEVISFTPNEILMEALLRTPFEVAINTMRGLSEPLAQMLLAATPPHRSMAYAEELEVPVSVRQSDFLSGRASFLQGLSSALKREGIDLLDLNLKVLSAYRGYQQL